MLGSKQAFTLLAGVNVAYLPRHSGRLLQYQRLAAKMQANDVNYLNA
jgi:hypothetical protein